MRIGKSNERASGDMGGLIRESLEHCLKFARHVVRGRCQIDHRVQKGGIIFRNEEKGGGGMTSPSDERNQNTARQGK